MRPFLTRRWGIDTCLLYFEMGAEEEAWVAGSEGRQRLLGLWDAHPEQYDDHRLTILRQEWWHAYHGMYRHPGFWDALGPGAVVADYGCGVGAVTLPWIGREEMTLLVEHSPVVLEYLRHKFAIWPEVLVMDAKTFLQGNIHVDALVCTDVLEHVLNPMELQMQVWDHLKPRGHALLKMEDAYPHAGHLKESVVQRPEWLRWVRQETEVIELETYAWVRKRHERDGAVGSGRGITGTG